jgi:acyl-CoA synthetase (AMP-forming)/AMP-acid ligase II
MGFAKAFLSQVEKKPFSTFITQGKERLSYSEALHQINALNVKNLGDLALKSNTISGVLAWMALELARISDEHETAVDFVRTSGSTGSPKEFYVSLESQLVTARAINQSILFNADLEELIVLPISHSSARGRLRAAVLRGATIHLASNPFTFKSINGEFLNSAPFAMATTPTTFRYLGQRLGDKLWTFFGGLKSLEFGSAEIRESEQRRLIDESPSDLDIYMHYGLSEASRSFIRDVRETSWNSLGDPMPHTNYQITEEGQLIISGPHIASQEITQDGRVPVSEIQTGDLCTSSGDGKVHLIGRLKNTINCGGYTLYTEQLESSLGTDIELSSLAIGKARDELLGEVPVLIVPVGLKERALEAWGEIELSRKGVAYPMVVEIDSIPSLPSGKLDRQSLNEVAEKNYLKMGT